MNAAWLRLQGHRLPETLEVTGLNPGQGKNTLIKIEKNAPKGFLTLKKVHLSTRKKGHLS
jgi:hypothetical protein